MKEPHDPNRTVDVPSAPADSLDAGLAAGFAAPRSSLGASQRPVPLKEAEGESAHVVKPNSDAMPDRAETGDRYQLQGEIARGGMGAVLRARDVDLGRDLAVKVLLEKHADNPAVARRFLEEAQVGAQLQHPGVVPVYDIGRFGDRPFFTMKLVKGRTLSALLAERAVPSADRPRLLGVVLQVAQAMAYAHAKGVIHRDLKPANVMVGAFGEVQVMDWGLAKVLHEGGPADEEKASREHQDEGTQIRTARSSGSTGSFGTDTEAGSLLGTPAYMPPEQAQGDIAHLDRRADVFGLGAILCEILTGRAPYVGRSSEEVRRKACNGDLADARARLDGCGADAELIRLTKTCLASEALDRPKDARQVAEALTAYLDGVQERLRQAELAEAEAKARAIEELKRRRLTLTLAATVLLALTLGGGAWLWVKTERAARRARVARDANDALNQATALREKARTTTTGSAALFAQAREQVQRARALVESGPADTALVAQVQQLQVDLDAEEKDRKMVAALDEARLAQAETVAREGRFAKERAVPLFREAFRAYGLPPGEGEPGAVAERIRQRPAVVREAVVAALDEWVEITGHPKARIDEPHREWLLAVLEAAEPTDGWARRTREANREIDRARRQAALEKLAKEADVRKLPARALTRLASRLRPQQAATLLRRAYREHSGDFWVNHGLGMALLQEPPELDEAVRFLTAATALRPESPGAFLNLGVALSRKGLHDEAEACDRKALALNPNYTSAHVNLAGSLYTRGKHDEAIVHCKKALALAPNDPQALCNLGASLNGKGERDAAIAALRKAIKLSPDYGLPYCHLGVVLSKKGLHDEAIACYRKGIRLFPVNAPAHTNLGLELHSQGQLAEAIASFRKAIEIDPRNATAHGALGRALKARGRHDEALASFKKAIELDPKLAAAHANLGAFLLDVKKDDQGAIAAYQKAIELNPKDAASHSGLGAALRHVGRIDEAIGSCRQAVKLGPKYATPHINLGLALSARGLHEEAIACYRKAAELDRKDTLALKNLGDALLARGRYDEALASDREAIKRNPKDADAHYGLGIVLFTQGKLDEAIASYRKALVLRPEYAKAHYNLGLALAGKGKVDEAIECYRKAIELGPQLAEPHCNLGGALLSQGRFAEALASYRRGHELGLKQPRWRYPSAEWVRDAEVWAALEAKLLAWLEGELRPRDANERLGMAKVCGAKKWPHAAARLYAEAFAADAKLAHDLQAAHRYNAACHAALAAAGQSENGGKLDERERAGLRRQALTWLRADLAGHARQLRSGAPGPRASVAQALQGWQKDASLAGLRDAAALAKLPAEERAACEKLWADVAALLKRAKPNIK
jgi:serine/threonine-protein kinase